MVSPSKNFNLISIIVPCYNEEQTIIKIIDKINNNKIKNKEIIVVDDNSTDNSFHLLSEVSVKYKNLHILQNKKNKGKGYCVRKGIDRSKGDIILIQDADLEYDPNEHIKLIEPILNDCADVVYGSRFFGGSKRRVLYFYHRIANYILTFLSNLTTNLDLTDMETCFKAFKSDIVKNISLKEDRFGFEPEITAKISKIPNCRIYEVGISYNGRKYSEGKKIKLIDAFEALYCILKYKFFN